LSETAQGSRLFSDYVKGRGVPVHPSAESMSQRQDRVADFDLIMHFFVLEHVRKPKSFLEQQLSLLAPGGKLVFEVPNAADPLYTIYDIPAFERFYWSVAHAWYFSRASLEHLLASLGVTFKIMGDQRYDLSNHLVWARDGRPGGMGRFSRLLGQEIEDQYRQNLIETGHCDTLVAIVHKDRPSLGISGKRYSGPPTGRTQSSALDQ
jgi:SAM-dependent methyltransferase